MRRVQRTAYLAPRGAGPVRSRTLAAGGAHTRAQDAHSALQLEGKPASAGTRNAASVEELERAAAAVSRLADTLGVHPRELLEGLASRAVEATVRLVNQRPHLHSELERAVVVGLLCVCILPF